MTQRAAASLYRGISSEVALLRQPGRATTPATGRTRVNARFTALDRGQGRSETRDQSQKRVGVENSDSRQFRPVAGCGRRRQGCQLFGLGSPASVSAVVRKR